MAIVKEFVLKRDDGKEIYRCYSDDHRYVIQNETGLKFEVAEDIYPCKYTYSESEEYLESYQEELDKQINEQYTDELVDEAISNKEMILETSNNIIQ